MYTCNEHLEKKEYSLQQMVLEQLVIHIKEIDPHLHFISYIKNELKMINRPTC